MKNFFIAYFSSLFFLLSVAHAQVVVEGKIVDEENQAVPQVWIGVQTGSHNTLSDSLGHYRLYVPSNKPFELTFRFLGFQSVAKTIDPNKGELQQLNVRLDKDTKLLQAVEISQSPIRPEAAGITKINPKSAQVLPSAFQDFNKILVTLPGVVSNNEFSSNYQVRGGNFDENLVYVNGMQVYRPFLNRSGQQEGLSFINPDMVQNVEFSAGGWEARFGDKLSSNLNITYKTPETFGASATFGLLGGSLHAKGTSPDGRFTYLAGLRHKDSRYLLQTLDVKGQYRPRFTDFQSYLTYKLSDGKGKPATKLGLLTTYAQNFYFVQPESRQTKFGSFNDVKVLYVAFEGQEKMSYDIIQSGLQLEHWLSPKLKTQWVISGLYTLEREAFDIEGFYLLSNVDTDPESSTFNEPIETLGVGTNYKSARNNLQAQILNFSQVSSWSFDDTQILEFGFAGGIEHIQDRVREYAFVDSADYIHIDKEIYGNVDLNSFRLSGFGQYSLESDEHKVTAGVRTNYWSLNKQLLWSPRLQYSYEPATWSQPWAFKVALGVYQQPPFYRELRRPDGSVNYNVKAQSSFHFIVGADHIFQLWERDFKLTSEAYYKHLWNIVPYDIDDVRIIYHAHNDAKAFATGVDFRVNGEFIKGTESWFSIGILSTREDILTDNQGYIRRPSDQRLNIGVFFEDHIPGDPSLRLYLNTLYGSGLAFGPPNNSELRGAFSGGDYKRVDIGVTKAFKWGKTEQDNMIFGIEVLNMLGTSNQISYTWIQDVQGNMNAVPNELSQRFWNAKLTVKL